SRVGPKRGRRAGFASGCRHSASVRHAEWSTGKNRFVWSWRVSGPRGAGVLANHRAERFTGHGARTNDFAERTSPCVGGAGTCEHRELNLVGWDKLAAASAGPPEHKG